MFDPTFDGCHGLTAVQLQREADVARAAAIAVPTDAEATRPAPRGWEFADTDIGDLP